MPAEKTLQQNGSEVSGPACLKALGETSKALKAFAFYPENHPVRQQIVKGAYDAVAELVKSASVSLVVQRTGFSLANRKDAFENNPMTRALAQELFARELQRLTFLPGVTISEFSTFLTVLASAPQTVASEGGAAEMLKRSGVVSIVLNQIDISAVFTKKTTGEEADAAVADGADAPEEDEQETGPSQAIAESRVREMGIDELIAAMAPEENYDRYSALASLLVRKALPLKDDRNFDRLSMVMTAIAEQHSAPGRSAAGRACAVMVLQQLGSGETAQHLLDHLEDADYPKNESIYRLLNLLGLEVADAVVRRFTAAKGKHAKNALAGALIRIGTPAQPALLPLLNDARWQIVYAAAAILGEMGNRDAVKPLSLIATHPEPRVRAQGIRSLAKIGGVEATAALLSLIQEGDQGSALQAIASLGGSRNYMALQALLALVRRRDLFGKRQALKKEALTAIGRIGDRRALAPLFRLVGRRWSLAPKRALELKLAAIDAIAALDGEPARAFLQKVSSRGGEPGRAADAALADLARREKP